MTIHLQFLDGQHFLHKLINRSVAIKQHKFQVKLLDCQKHPHDLKDNREQISVTLHTS